MSDGKLMCEETENWEQKSASCTQRRDCVVNKEGSQPQDISAISSEYQHSAAGPVFVYAVSNSRCQSRLSALRYCAMKLFSSLSMNWALFLQHRYDH